MEKSYVLTVRVTESMLTRIDRLAKLLSRPGTASTRAMALRYVIVKGLDDAEAVRGLSKPRARPVRR